MTKLINAIVAMFATTTPTTTNTFPALFQAEESWDEIPFGGYSNEKDWDDDKTQPSYTPFEEEVTNPFND